MQVSMPNSKRPVQITSSDPDQSDLDSQSSSEDVTEDELGTELTPALDAAILQTLGRIKRGEGVYGEEDVLGDAFRQAEARARALKFRPMAGVQKAEKVPLSCQKEGKC